MKSFLVKDKKPIVKWGDLPDETYFEGKVPDGYKLAICPSKGYIIIDVDVDNEKGKNGFKNIPGFYDFVNIDLRTGLPINPIYQELEKTLKYDTKRGGRHYWLKYTGNKDLPNKTSGLDIDLRTHNGYVVWYLPKDIRWYKTLINETSEQLNEWIEKTFYYVNKKTSN